MELLNTKLKGFNIKSCTVSNKYYTDDGKFKIVAILPAQCMCESLTVRTLVRAPVQLLGRLFPWLSPTGIKI